MQRPISRELAAALETDLRQFPVVALLGPRQCGKTTLARLIAGQSTRPTLFLDLEKHSDLAMLQDPETFLRRHADALVCLDEVQRKPDVFPVLRVLVDEDRRPGRFLILGSASPALLRQSSESLAGRIAQRELTPFLWSEVVPSGRVSQDSLWLRGGFPGSVLADDDASSFRWREEFIRTFLERDLPQLGFRVPAPTMRRFWSMCAHLQGQVLNLSALGRAIGTTHTAVRHYLDMLEQTYVLRSLPPLVANLGKRLVKSPKIYLRDSGIVHALLGLGTLDDVSGHPVFGTSWEAFVIEQVLASAHGWTASYYRTAAGEELDLVLEKRNVRIAVECKASGAPAVSRGFWRSLDDLRISEAYVVAQIREAFPLGDRAEAVPLSDLLRRLAS